MTFRALATLSAIFLTAACGSGGTGDDPGVGGDAGGDGSGVGDSGSPPAPPPGPPGWVEVARESFDGALGMGAFVADPVPDDGAFADAGRFFTAKGVVPPAAFRATQPFGLNGWLTLEAYTRRAGAALGDHAGIVADPADASNRVLRITSRAHTDAAVVRPTQPLPAKYRVSLRVGFPAFGDGKPGLNGYDAGDEKAGPWWPNDAATSQNGFYWLTILDHVPRPHNNTWIHHHRKVVVDSDNHYPAWMEIWDGSRFLSSGEHPVMVIALDGSRVGNERAGNPFRSYSNGAWQPSGAIRAVDAYVPGEWYRVTIERDGPRYAIEISGRFRFGGETTYRAAIDAAGECIWHYPATAEEASGATGCEDAGSFASVVPPEPRWPGGGVWPDWFMFGDPHSNYYEGSVHYDDVVLEVWR